MQLYDIRPQDLLFFRDGRPMETGEGSGRGATWPAPTVFFDALHAALHRAFPDASDSPWDSGHAERGGRVPKLTHRRFGALTTVGPFPRSIDADGHDHGWLFPAPLDALPGGDGSAVGLRPIPAKMAGRTDLPSPLVMPLGSIAAPSKMPVRPWWPRDAITAFLDSGSLPAEAATFDYSHLYAAEHTTGIGIDNKTGTQDGERIYSAEYLRLRENASIGLAATLPTADGSGDGLCELFPAAGGRIVAGGQQRVCHVSPLSGTRLSDILPASAAVTGTRVRWQLLTPALFPALAANPGKKIPSHPGGWLPSWVAPDSGMVMLPALPPTQLARQPDERRTTWRKRVASSPKLDCHLVAASIGKATVLTGWSDHLADSSGAKSTRLAVPAGSSYFFEGPDAPLLAELLAWDGGGEGAPLQRRSSALGEKGLGLGVCGPWSPFPSD
ncbi:hypothetical protein BH23VER1_BH23VER1_27100 [soil metagenome]